MCALRSLLVSTAAALALAACSDDDQAPATLPSKVALSVPAQAEVGEPVKLSSNADAANQGLSFEWDFGDGSRSSEPMPAHAYARPGRYDIRLTISNSNSERVVSATHLQAGRFSMVAGRVCAKGPAQGWCLQYPPDAEADPVDAGASRGIAGLHFFDAKRGIALDLQGALLDTLDGGRNWTRRSQADFDSALGSQLQFTTGGKGWLLAGNVLWQSSDGGRNWRTLELPLPPSPLRALLLDFQLIDALHGWVQVSICSGTGKTSICHAVVYGTQDGGQHWTALAAPESGWQAGRLRFIEVSTAVLASVDGRIWRSSDAGRSWQRSAVDAPAGTGGSMMALRFLGADRGWLLSALQVTPLLRSDDGGRSWRAVPLPAGLPTLRAVHFADARHGWIVGERGTILHTDNGGDSWTLQDSGTTRSLSTVFALDSGTAWVGSDSRAILATATGGQ